MHKHLPELFQAVVAEHGDRPAARQRWGGGEWETWTYAEMGERATTAACALVAEGLEPGDRVALFSHNRVEWHQADFACLLAGAIVVPIYPSSTPEQCRHIFRDAGVTMAIVEGQVELDKLLEIAGDVPDLRRIITFGPVDARGDDRVRAWWELAADTPELRTEVRARVDALDPASVATLIYTSGTTGDPKGVMLTHANFMAEFAALDVMFDGIISPADHSLCFLPLSHALERGWSYYVFSHGCMNTYVQNPKQVADYLVDVRPTLFVSVPALYEKVYAVAQQKVAGSSVKRGIFRWANRVGGRVQRANRKGKRETLFWRAQLPLAERLVFRNVRDAIGGQKTVLACGGAPLRQEVEEFFSAAGMLLLQGYGLTEAAPLVSFNAPTAFKFGTAGRVMSGGEIRLGEDGEIHYRGDNVMAGYWNNEEATRETIDEQGWLHTGDVGYVDNQGYLVITDRLKDILITTGGKNIAPQPIEGLLLNDPLIDYAVLLGNNRPCLTLLVSPSLPDLEALAKDLQIRWDNRDELFSNEQVLEAVKERVAALTAKLPGHEQIRDIRLMAAPTLENGLLTPTLKVKRREVEQRFKDMIDDMYARLAERRRKQG